MDAPHPHGYDPGGTGSSAATNRPPSGGKCMNAVTDRRWQYLIAILAVTCLLGWFFKAHCMPGGWTNSEQYTTGCYSDAVPFWTSRGLYTGAVPYFDAPMEYPVLTGMLIWIEASLARMVGGAGANAAHFLYFVTFANAALAVLLLFLFRRVNMPPERMLAWAAAPVLVLYLGHNWDMLAVAFTVTAMLLARSNQLTAAAAVAGLGVAAKLFPVLLLPLIGLQALFGDPRADWRTRILRGAAVTAAAIGAWALVNLPVAIGNFTNWSEFYRFSSARDGTAASFWVQMALNGWWATDIASRNLYAALLFLAGAATILAVGWRTHRTHLWTLMPPVLIWFMLTNKVYSPQFDLWVYPLLLLAAPRMAPVLLFAVGDVAAYFAEFWYFAGMEGQHPSATMHDIGLAALFRGAMMLWCVVDALRLPSPDWLVGETDATDGQDTARAQPA